MMVPRAYHYMATPLSRSPSPTKREKSAASRSPKTKPTTTSQPPRSKSSTDRPSVHAKLNTVSPATPSKPVVIPTRTRSSQERRIPRSQQDVSAEPEAPGHDRNAIPPSMAALLAITSIPRPKTLASRKNGRGRRIEADSINEDEFRPSPSTASPKSWTILQSSPDEYDNDDDSRTERSVDGATDASSIMSGSAIVPSSFRSMSSDSLPSLDVDLDCDSAQSFSPPSPAQRPRYRNPRDRQSSPAVPVCSDSEHPLATSRSPDPAHASPPTLPVSEDTEELFTPPASTASTSFKSNLTASLRLLRSAAKVLSAPTRLHDHTSLTIPTNLTSPPPAPQTAVDPPLTPKSADFFLSNNIDALPLHLSAHLPGPPPTMSIQLQPCQTSPLSTPTATAPPIFLSSKVSTDEPEIKPAQREPRENSDFLRVVVLEMNMRRAGKLSGEGRARIWLGARQEPALRAAARPTAGIADGGEAHGAVFLDGELGEAQEVEVEIEQQHHLHPQPHRPPLHDSIEGPVERRQRRPPSGRAHRVPRRWVPILP